MQVLRNRVAELQRHYLTVKVRADVLRESLVDKQRELDGYATTKECTRQEALLIQKTCEAARNEACARLEQLGTSALQAVFGADYKLLITLDQQRDAVALKLGVVSNNYRTPTEPAETRGGGVVDVVSLVLRATIMSLYRPAIPGPLLLDEPFKMVSAGLVEHCGQLFVHLAHRLGRQIIAVTHSAELGRIADNVKVIN